METIVIDNKRFVIKKCNPHKDNLCDKCLFYHNSNYTNPSYYCAMTPCFNFIVIKEVNVIDKIRMWFKKKDKEMKTIIINHKMYEIQDDIYCTNCMFYDRNHRPHCKHNMPSITECFNGKFIYVREIKFFERIKLWFKKKINK